MIDDKQFLARIEAYLLATGETASSFGKRMGNDTAMMRELRMGRSPRLVLVHKIMTEIEAHEAAETAGV